MAEKLKQKEMGVFPAKKALGKGIFSRWGIICLKKKKIAATDGLRVFL